MMKSTTMFVTTTTTTIAPIIIIILLPIILVVVVSQQQQQELFCHAYFHHLLPVLPHRRWTQSVSTITSSSSSILYLSSSSSSSSDPSSSSSSSSSSSFQQSRLFGNQREPTPTELQIMDEMILKLANAKPYDLPLVVQRAYHVISSPRFFVRIAELVDQLHSDNDESDDTEEKMKLITLADNLVSTLDAIMSTAQEKMQASTQDVERVIKAAAEPESGEFLVPLSAERLQAMRHVMNTMDTVSLDGDSFVSTIDAYIIKSHQDGYDLMVVILQNVLQLYAGRRIYEARQRIAASAVTIGENTPTTATPTTTIATRTAGELLDELLQTDADQWDTTIRNTLMARAESAVPTDTSDPIRLAEELILEIQRNMESIVLSLESGSMSQRVQAEYLQELVQRMDHVKQTL